MPHNERCGKPDSIRNKRRKKKPAYLVGKQAGDLYCLLFIGFSAYSVLIYTKNVRLVSFNLEFRGNLDYLL